MSTWQLLRIALELPAGHAGRYHCRRRTDVLWLWLQLDALGRGRNCHRSRNFRSAGGARTAWDRPGDLGNVNWSTQMYGTTPEYLAVPFAVAIGVFFGFYPARKPAQLNPVDALRFE